MKKLLLLTLLLLTGSLSAAAPSGNVQLTAVTEPVICDGFYIVPAPKSKWKLIVNSSRLQRRTVGFAIVDPADKLHTMLASVSISPPLQGFMRENMSLATLKERIEKYYTRNLDSRVKELKVTSRYTTVNKVKFAEISASAWDAGSKYAVPAAKLMLYARIFVTLTPDYRMVTISVSERIPGDSKKPDNEAVEACIKMVRLGKPEK